MDAQIAFDAPPETHIMLRVWCRLLCVTKEADVACRVESAFPSKLDLWMLPKLCESRNEDGCSYIRGECRETGDRITRWLRRRGGSNQPAGMRFPDTHHLELWPRVLPPREETELTRMEAVKELFDAFINRSIAYNYPTAIGLVPFSTDVPEADEIEITPSYEDFREEIQDMEAAGEACLLWNTVGSLVPFFSGLGWANVSKKKCQNGTLMLHTRRACMTL